MQIPFVGFQLVRTSEDMASAGVFVLLQAVLVLKYVQNYMSKAELKYFDGAAGGTGFFLGWGHTFVHRHENVF